MISRFVYRLLMDGEVEIARFLRFYMRLVGDIRNLNTIGVFSLDL